MPRHRADPSCIGPPHPPFPNGKGLQGSKCRPSVPQGLLVCTSLFSPSVDSFKPGELENIPEEIDLTSFIPGDTVPQEKIVLSSLRSGCYLACGRAIFILTNTIAVKYLLHYVEKVNKTNKYLDILSKACLTGTLNRMFPCCINLPLSALWKSPLAEPVLRI